MTGAHRMAGDDETDFVRPFGELIEHWSESRDSATAYAIGELPPEHRPAHDRHDVPRAERTGPLPVIPADLQVNVNRIHTVLRDSLGLDWHQTAEDRTLFDLDGTDDWDGRDYRNWTRGQLDRLRGPVRDVTEQYVRELAEPVWPTVDPDDHRLPAWDPTRLVLHASVILAAVWLTWGITAHVVDRWFLVAVVALCALEGLRLVFPSATAGWLLWGRHRAATAWKHVTALQGNR